jgi:hypothetical protein
MPKSTHQHQAHDAMSTDNKFRPEDEKILLQDKREFQGPEKKKQHEARTEKQFVADQDKLNQE